MSVANLKWTNQWLEKWVYTMKEEVHWCKEGYISWLYHGDFTFYHYFQTIHSSPGYSNTGTKISIKLLRFKGKGLEIFDNYMYFQNSSNHIPSTIHATYNYKNSILNQLSSWKLIHCRIHMGCCCDWGLDWNCYISVLILGWNYLLFFQVYTTPK